MRIKAWFIQALIISALGGLCFGMFNKIQDLREQVSVAYVNQKAYAAERDSLNNELRAFKFTIDELKDSKDSINIKLLSVQKKLKIRDKDVAWLQYRLSTMTKADTVYIPGDTIFAKPDFKLDTVIKDKWYSLNLGLEYPNMVAVKPKFTSELSVVGHMKKETIKPPKKCFIGRWFQRKHKVLIMDVIEENPYSNSEAQRFIQVID